MELRWGEEQVVRGSSASGLNQVISTPRGTARVSSFTKRRWLLEGILGSSGG